MKLSRRGFFSGLAAALGTSALAPLVAKSAPVYTQMAVYPTPTLSPNLRVAGWKMFYGTQIANLEFEERINSAKAFTASFG